MIKRPEDVLIIRESVQCKGSIEQRLERSIRHASLSMAHELINMFCDELGRFIAPRLESLRERVDERICKVLVGLIRGEIDECLIEHCIRKRLELEETVDHLVVF